MKLLGSKDSIARPARFLALAQLPSSEAIVRKAEEVVARPDYQLDTAMSDEARAWWAQVLRWILTPFRWLFEALEGLPEPLRWVIVIGLSIVLAALIAHIIWSFVSAVRGTPIRSRGGLKHREQERSPTELEQEAEALAAQGDYIGSIRLLFRAALVRLQAAEKKRFRPGFTNRELLRRYRSSPLFDPLTRFVETIDAKWYGEEPCDQSDYAACRDDHQRLRTLIERPAHAVGA